MPIHEQRKQVRHSADDMLAIVQAVDKYPEFLPWCTGARIRSRDIRGDQEIMIADLMVAFKVFRETFTSRVHIDRKTRTIDVEYLNGPFKYLTNRWHFEPHDDGSCTIDFYIEFEFKSRALQMLISAVFGEAVHRMVSAFEARADALYGQVSGANPPP